jgi:hypothetical protein
VLDAARSGIDLVRDATVTAITPTAVHHRRTSAADGGQTGMIEGAVEGAVEGVDDVLVTLVPEPSDASPEHPLVAELRAAGVETHVVGDAAGVGYLLGAIHGAHAVATAL